MWNSQKLNDNFDFFSGVPYADKALSFFQVKCFVAIPISSTY